MPSYLDIQISNNERPGHIYIRNTTPQILTLYFYSSISEVIENRGELIWKGSYHKEVLTVSVNNVTDKAKSFSNNFPDDFKEQVSNKINEVIDKHLNGTTQ